MTTENTNQMTNRVILTINGRDEILEQSVVGVTMDSSEREILNAVQGMIQESLSDSGGEYSFTVRKTTNSNNIYIYPKPVAG